MVDSVIIVNELSIYLRTIEVLPTDLLPSITILKVGGGYAGWEGPVFEELELEREGDNYEGVEDGEPIIFAIDLRNIIM